MKTLMRLSCLCANNFSLEYAEEISPIHYFKYFMPTFYADNIESQFLQLINLSLIPGECVWKSFDLLEDKN